jgi:hypothetical protein
MWNLPPRSLRARLPHSRNRGRLVRSASGHEGFCFRPNPAVGNRRRPAFRAKARVSPPRPGSRTWLNRERAGSGSCASPNPGLARGRAEFAIYRGKLRRGLAPGERLAALLSVGVRAAFIPSGEAPLPHGPLFAGPAVGGSRDRIQCGGAVWREGPRRGVGATRVRALSGGARIRRLRAG